MTQGSGLTEVNGVAFGISHLNGKLLSWRPSSFFKVSSLQLVPGVKMLSR